MGESGHEALGVLAEAAGGSERGAPAPNAPNLRPPHEKSPASHFGKRGFVSS